MSTKNLSSLVHLLRLGSGVCVPLRFSLPSSTLFAPPPFVKHGPHPPHVFRIQFWVSCATLAHSPRWAQGPFPVLPYPPIRGGDTCPTCLSLAFAFAPPAALATIQTLQVVEKRMTQRRLGRNALRGVELQTRKKGFSVEVSGYILRIQCEECRTHQCTYFRYTEYIRSRCRFTE